MCEYHKSDHRWLIPSILCKSEDRLQDGKQQAMLPILGDDRSILPKDADFLSLPLPFRPCAQGYMLSFGNGLPGRSRPRSHPYRKELRPALTMLVKVSTST